jgi:hypothetical protein
MLQRMPVIRAVTAVPDQVRGGAASLLRSCYPQLLVHKPLIRRMSF